MLWRTRGSQGPGGRHPVSPRVTRCVASVARPQVARSRSRRGTCLAGRAARCSQWRGAEWPGSRWKGQLGACASLRPLSSPRARGVRWGRRDELPRVQRLAPPATPGNPRCHGVRASARGPFFKLLFPPFRRGQLKEQVEGPSAASAACGPHTAQGSPPRLGPEANRGKKPAQLCPCSPGTSEARPG